MRFDDLIAPRKEPEELIRLVAINYRNAERRRTAIGVAIAILLGALLMVVLWQVIQSPVSIGAPVTESEAIVRTNERLLEMMKWTISTLLIGGGAMIGLNWYTSEARYNLNRAMEEQEREHYRMKLEASLSLSVGLLEDGVEGFGEELEDRVWQLENPGRVRAAYIHSYETGETTLIADERDMTEEEINEEEEYRRWIVEHEAEPLITECESNDPNISECKQLRADHQGEDNHERID